MKQQDDTAIMLYPVILALLLGLALLLIMQSKHIARSETDNDWILDQNNPVSPIYHNPYTD